MIRTAILATLTALPIAAHELYVAEGAPAEAVEQALEPLQAAGAAEWERVVVPEQAGDMDAARRIARAIEAGVTALPCLALSDDAGVYAVLPLAGLTAETLAAAEAQPRPGAQAREAGRRHFAARLYLLCATASQPELGDDALAAAVAESRQLLDSAQADKEDRQFLGLRCLYPLLMMQYTRGYQGAHSPATEAKLLEAIAALEAARDLDRASKLGKAAHAERERLRAARRKSRQYE